MRNTYLMENLLQFILQLHEVAAADQAALQHVATGSGQLSELALDERQGPGGPR